MTQLETLLGIPMNGHLLKIWNGESSLSEEKAAKYRHTLIANSGRPASEFAEYLPRIGTVNPVVTPRSVISNITPADIPCQFRGDQLRIDKCTVCGQHGKPLPVFRCDDPNNKTHECTLLAKSAKIKSCQRCVHGRDAYDDFLTLPTETRPAIKNAEPSQVSSPRIRRIQKVNANPISSLPRAVVSSSSRTRRSRSGWASSFKHVCVHVGNDFHVQEANTDVYHCNHDKHDLCTLQNLQLPLINNEMVRSRCTGCETCPDKMLLPRFVTINELNDDIKLLVSKLPPDVTAVAGVARSGLHAATMVSMLLHVPLFAIRQAQGDVILAGNGWRLSQGAPDPKSGKVVVIDDTVMTGNSLRAIQGLVSKTFKDTITATVYVNPLAKKKPDIWARDLPWPHFLEWNIFNSVILPAAAFDFDGILCQDCPPQDDDDGPRYMNFLQNVRPKYITRKARIPLIVTARLEKYRKPTMEWMAKWGISCNRLVMGPWKNNQERSRHSMGEYKAKHFRQFLKLRHRIKPPVFIESCPHQAKQIAKLSGGVTICPATGKCYR